MTPGVKDLLQENEEDSSDPCGTHIHNQGVYVPASPVLHGRKLYPGDLLASLSEIESPWFSERSWLRRISKIARQLRRTS